MKKVLVVVASRHGATRGIGDRIASVLEAEGLHAAVVSAKAAKDVALADAVIVGSGVYMGSWLKDGVEFLEGHYPTLRMRPTWLFSSGPLKGSTKEQPGDPIENALGPATGPGSGGRKRIEALEEKIHVRGHRVFYGAFDPNDGPKAISEGFVRLMPAFKNVLPPGDFREWNEIEAWAREIAGELKATVQSPVLV